MTQCRRKSSADSGAGGLRAPSSVRPGGLCKGGSVVFSVRTLARHFQPAVGTADAVSPRLALGLTRPDKKTRGVGVPRQYVRTFIRSLSQCMYVCMYF